MGSTKGLTPDIGNDLPQPKRSPPRDVVLEAIEDALTEELVADGRPPEGKSAAFGAEPTDVSSIA